MAVQWLNLPAIPILGQLIQTVFFVLLVFGFFLWFASVAVTDQTIELGTKPKHLKILDLEVSYNAVVLKVTMIVAVFSGLSFVAATIGMRLTSWNRWCCVCEKS